MPIKINNGHRNEDKKAGHVNGKTIPEPGRGSRQDGEP